jgi:hypothetical protein
MVRRIVLTAALLGVGAGCSGIDHANIQGQTAVPGTSTLTTSGGNLQTGIAIAFKPHVWTRNTLGGTTEHTDSMGAQSSNGAIAQVAQVTNQGDQFVVWAVGPGTATVTVTYQGDTALSIPITVTDPPQ